MLSQLFLLESGLHGGAEALALLASLGEPATEVFIMALLRSAFALLQPAAAAPLPENLLVALSWSVP